ncbi:MAG: CDP-diacylglycerol--glycerol-3-phosphate 3-phosphatidyltransferase [Bauldia sp.]|nr:CDP-diacylglycerol--glycerol-3-phosphate 3-phosphatidyltransferase [Bauldia sp.]
MNRNSALSLPNLLTYGRIVAIPVILLLLFAGQDWARWTAMILFVIASVTDFLDGWIARAWQLGSTLGQVLDPIADKLLVAACLLMLVADGTISGWSVWAAIVILSREILVSGLREFLAGLQVGMPVTQLAKWKTAIQMVALGFLLAGPAGDHVFPYTTVVGLVLLWLAAVVTMYTGFDYLKAGFRHFVGRDA